MIKIKKEINNKTLLFLYMSEDDINCIEPKEGKFL